eukprot:4204433-Prymnesium_polylepis.1
MAHMLKHPTIKPQKGVVLLGPSGCGKGLLSMLLKHLLGHDSVVQTTSLMANWFSLNDLEDNTLVHLDGSDIRHELGKIKELISNQTIEYQDGYQVPSYHRVLVTTNALSPH